MPRQLETNDQIEDALLDQIIRFKFARPDDAVKQPNEPLRMAKICSEIKTGETNNAPEGECCRFVTIPVATNYELFTAVAPRATEADSKLSELFGRRI
jgi:hypothetical protein